MENEDEELQQLITLTEDNDFDGLLNLNTRLIQNNKFLREQMDKFKILYKDLKKESRLKCKYFNSIKCLIEEYEDEEMED